MQSILSRPFLLGAFVFCLAATGCGRSQHKVSGKVHFADGSPLTAGKIVAESSSDRLGASGYIREDGTFELGTTTPTDGLPPGTWEVVIVNAVTQPETFPDRPNVKQPTPLIHPRFTKKETAKLTFQVPEQLTWDITVAKQ